MNRQQRVWEFHQAREKKNAIFFMLEVFVKNLHIILG